MNTTPRHVPDIRAGLVRGYEASDPFVPRTPRPDRIPMTEAMRRSELYWCSAEMWNLAKHAATSFPDSHLITYSETLDLLGGDPSQPAIHLVVLEQPDTDLPVNDRVRSNLREGVTIEPQALQIGLTDDFNNHKLALGLGVTFVARIKHTDPPVDTWGPVAARFFHLGQRCEEIPTELLTVLSYLSILQSPGIATNTPHTLDRSTKRRMQRAEIPTDPVRVIALRHTRRPDDTSEEAQSNYSHRWIVQGHWRMQPYGPNRSRRRRIWIAPHIKGPDDAPLLDRPTVRALIR